MDQEPKDTFAYQFQLLVKEMDFLQETIRTYTTILMTVKSWSITLVGGLIVFALQQQSSGLMLVSWTTIVLFWVLDAMFRNIQRHYIRRYDEIEHYLRDELQQAVENRRISIAVPALGEVMARRDRRDRRDRFPFLHDALQRDTALLYASLLLITALFFFGSTLTYHILG